MSRIGVPSSMSTPRTCRLGFVATKQLDDGEADWIGAKRRASREDAVLAIVSGRCAKQLKRLCAVELPKHDQVGEAFDVGEAELEIGKDSDHAFCFMRGSKSFWYVSGSLVGRAYKSDGPRRKHMRLSLHLCVLCTSEPAVTASIQFDVTDQER